MEETKNNELIFQLSAFELSAEELRGRQSVRATFRLSSRVIELLSVAASQLGLKQKSLFDQLVEDQAILERLASEARQWSLAASDRHQKTFVLSRSSLMALDRVAREFKLPRDLLVEISINRLLPVITVEWEKQGKRKTILEEMERYQQQGLALLATTGQLLGEEDPLYRKLAAALLTGERNLAELRDQVERGREMEKYF